MKRNITQFAKKALPRPVYTVLFNIWIGHLERQINTYDRKRFKSHRLRDVNAANVSQLEGKLTFHSHAIEKGLSHDQVRLGFGERALKGMSAVFNVYEANGYDMNSAVFSNALSTLKAYIELHESEGYDTRFLDDIFGHFLSDARETDDNSGGAKTISRGSKAENQRKNFEDLFLNRHSVRTYEDSDVDLHKIKSAIQLSLKAPSVCNRQSGKIYIVTNQDTIAKVLIQQGGIGGYPTPPILIMITTDSSKFISPEERNQVYTDGGILSMALLLSLEYEGLAACPLNAMLPVKKEEEIRRLTQLSRSENIVMFISVGNFKENNNTPKSFRLKQEDITQVL